MQKQKFPYGYKYKETFEKIEIVKILEGTVICHAIKNDKNYLVIDSSTLKEFLDEKNDARLIAGLIEIMEFESIEEMNNHIKEKYERFGNFTVWTKSP